MYSCDLRTWDVCTRVWLRDVNTWWWIYESLFMCVTCHLIHMRVCTPTRVRASDLEEQRVRYNMISWTWFLYIEEFSILPCPACPTYQSYISVGFIHDTFVSTLPCPVSKIRQCIRYDGWTAKWGIWEMNIRNVRFCMRFGIHPVYAIWSAYAVVCSLRDSYPCALWLLCDMCDIRVLSIMVPWVWFLYIEEFSKLSCPTCPTCRLLWQ